MTAPTKQKDDFPIRNRHSKYKGVYWHKGNKRWVAKLTVDKTSVWLGYHDSEIDAARAFDEGVQQWREKTDKFLVTNAMLGLLPKESGKESRQ